jgi:hypothetical protein
MPGQPRQEKIRQQKRNGIPRHRAIVPLSKDARVKSKVCGPHQRDVKRRQPHIPEEPLNLVVLEEEIRIVEEATSVRQGSP